jgi:signal transduction histidine kinase
VIPETAPAVVLEGFLEEFIAIWEDRDGLMIEVQGATVDGGTTDLALSWAAARNEDGSLDLARVVVAIQDVAIIKQAERELEKLVESKDDLIAAVSHELRTPITTILGMAFELRDHSSTFSGEEISDFSSMIADQSRELSNIVEDLLVAAHSEAGTLTIRPECVDIELEIAHILTADPQGPEVLIKGPIVAWADPLRLRQILRNLFSNAARYGGSTVTVDAESSGGVTFIRVRDSGVGIPRSQRESIFEPYVHAPGDAALPGSLGLGLPVSRTLSRLMGGDLVYRHDGTSVFELTLPAEPAGD